MSESKLTKKQSVEFTATGKVYGEVADITATVRYDDQCNNGHNTFSIIGEAMKGRECIAAGCIHDVIAKHFPKLRHLLKWHLVSSDGPLHYIGNTTFHARDTDTDGKQPGDAIGFDTLLQFGEFPILFKQKQRGFFEYLDSVGDFNNIFVEEIKHEKTDGYQFKPKYSLTGFNSEETRHQWSKCPFDTRGEAMRFLLALRTINFKYVQIPVKWCEAVEPNIEHARSCAIWPDATLEQLRDEKALADRLPALMAEFRKDVEALGFTY